MSKKSFDYDWGDENWKDRRDKSVNARFSPPKKSPQIVVTPKTENQRKYIEEINDKILTLCSGPAGCGKTFLPIGIALNLLRNEKIDKLIMTRPMVESGRKLGAMPGDLSEKYGIYIRPLFDNILQFVEQTELDGYVSSKKVEFIPLELMRGSSINNSFIILDEAQNVEKEQMLMFLTRIGQNTKAVVCGDLDQDDLRMHFRNFDKIDSGFAYAFRNLKENRMIGTAILDESDIVRSELVKYIVTEWKNGD